MQKNHDHSEVIIVRRVPNSITELHLTMCRRQLEREQGKNRMLLLKLSQRDDDVIWPEGQEDQTPLAAVKTEAAGPLPETGALPAAAALPALRNPPRQLNLDSSFDNSSLNSSSSSGSSSSGYFLAACPSSGVFARRGSRHGTADRLLTVTSAVTPSPPLAESIDQVGQVEDCT
jgi:hypothetical protein